MKAMALTPFAGLAGCDGMLSPYIRRFQYKITVRFDGREYVGSSVYEVRWGRNLVANFDAAGVYSLRAIGQAPFVVLPNVGPLFALITPVQNTRAFAIVRTAEALAKYAPEELQRKGGDDEFRYLMDLPGEHDLDLTGDNAPALIYFSPPQDFMSITLVPESSATVEGKSFSLQRATLTLTDSPITRNITAQTLPTFDGAWIHPPYHAAPRTLFADRPLAGRITSECFNLGGQSS